MSQNNSIEIVSVVMGAGESRLFALSGEYFEIIDAPNPVDVVLSDFNGAQRARMNQASASFYSKGVEYGVIQITSASAQTIRFAYGSGETGTRRATGSVTISGPVALDAATLLALEQISIRPEANTGTWSNAAALTANTPVTVFAPGANTNSVILMAASFAERNSGANMNSCFIAKAGAAPTTTSDGDVIVGPDCMSLGTSDVLIAGSLKSLQLIPANFGLYYISSAAVAVTSNFRAARWRAL